MRPLSKDLENIIEESKYQVRLEIAEKCIIQRSSMEFIMSVCSLSKEEVTTIFNNLKKINPSIKSLMSESKQVKQIIKNERILEIDEQITEVSLTLKQIKEKEKELKLKEKEVIAQERQLKSQERHLKRLDNQKIINYRGDRQREADIQREIAAENTRLLMKRMREDERNSKILETELLDLREQKIEKERKKMELQKLKDLKKAKVDKEVDFLSKEQKMIASIGNCYLRGLNVEQAILFSKQSKEDVERIYKTFKNK